MYFRRCRVARDPPERLDDPPRVLDFDPLRVGVPQVDDPHQGIPLLLLGAGRVLEPGEHDGSDRRRLVAQCGPECRSRRQDVRQLVRRLAVEAKVEQLGRVAVCVGVDCLCRGGAAGARSGLGVAGPDVLSAEEDLLQQALVPQVLVTLGVTQDRVWPRLFVFPDELSLFVEVGLADQPRLALAARLLCWC